MNIQPDLKAIDDGITLSQLLVKIRDYYQEIRRKFVFFLAIVSLFVAGFVIYALLTPPTFPAKLTFMVNEDDASKLTGAVSFVSSFIGGGSEQNLQKVLDLSKSFQIVKRGLLSKSKVRGGYDYYANHLIREYDLHEEWADDTTGMNGLLFTHDDFDKFTRSDRKAMNILHRLIVGDTEEGVVGLMENSFNDVTGIMTLKLRTTSEDLSINLIDTLYEELSRFYVHNQTEKAYKTYEILKQKTDSLNNAVNIAQRRYLQFIDRNKNLILKQSESQKLKLEREMQMAGAILVEVSKNTALAEFSLQNSTPYIQDIDRPFAPIESKVFSLPKAIIYGLFLGGFFAIIIIIIRKIIRDFKIPES